MDRNPSLSDVPPKPIKKKPVTALKVETAKLKWHDIVVLPLAKLKDASYNPRIISEDAVKGLTKSIERFGLVEPIVVNKRTYTIIGGHQRVAVLKASGAIETQVVLVDLSDEEERALNVTLNNSEIQGEFNNDALASLLDQIRSEKAVDFDGIGLEDLLNTLCLPPESFPAVDETIHTNHTCPKCGYTWNGQK